VGFFGGRGGNKITELANMNKERKNKIKSNNLYKNQG
jgi:hypothetical protein